MCLFLFAKLPNSLYLTPEDCVRSESGLINSKPDMLVELDYCEDVMLSCCDDEVSLKQQRLKNLWLGLNLLSSFTI